MPFQTPMTFQETLGGMFIIDRCLLNIKSHVHIHLWQWGLLPLHLACLWTEYDKYQILIISF